MAVELQKLGYTTLCALDISEGMLNEARKKNVYKKFICAALTDQEIPEIQTGEFDALICGGAMFKGHIRSSALTEMVRIVKGGKSASGIMGVVFIRRIHLISASTALRLTVRESSIANRA